MNIPLLDLKAQYQSIKSDIDAAVTRVLSSQSFILGPEVEACERRLADYCDCAYAVGLSSGTDALLASLMAEGIGPGDEVLTTAYSFFATAGSIVRVGARPVFIDIDPLSYNLNPDFVESHITPQTRVLMPVHLYGQTAEMDQLVEIATKYDLVVIEDSAQAIGAQYKGRRVGSMGAYGCLSFFPSKNLGAAGDSGMVLTQDAERAATLRRLRTHGAERSYHHERIGGNFRLDALQASIITTKLPHLDNWTAARQSNAYRYQKFFEATAPVRDGLLTLPQIPQSRHCHVFHQYVVRTRRRDALKAFLEQRGIGSAVYYPIPLPLQQCFAYLGCQPGDFPESEKAAQETLALPMYPELTEGQAYMVVQAVSDFFAKG